MSDERVDSSTATAVKPPRKPRVDRGISNEEFYAVWQASESPKQVAEKLSNDKRGTVDIKYVSTKAAALRKIGMDLKSFRTGNSGRHVRVDPALIEVNYWASTQNPAIVQGSDAYNERLAKVRERIAASLKEKAEQAAKRAEAKRAAEAAKQGQQG